MTACIGLFNYKENLGGMPRVHPYISEPYSTIIAELINDGKIISIIVNYAAPYHASLSKMCLCALNKDIASGNKAFDFFTFSVQVLRHFGDNIRRKETVGAWECEVPFFQDLSWTKKHHPKQFSEVRESNRRVGTLSELYGFEVSAENSSLEEYYACLELIHEELSQIPVELMWSREVSTRWEYTDRRQKRYRSGFSERPNLSQEMQALQEKCKVFYRQIDVKAKALESFYHDFSYNRAKGSSVVLRCLDTCAIYYTLDPPCVDKFRNEYTLQQTEYVFRLLESFDESHIALEKESTNARVIFNNLKEIADKIPILRPVLDIENVDERFALVVNKIQSYIEKNEPSNAPEEDDSCIIL